VSTDLEQWKARAERAEAKVRAVEAQCNRLEGRTGYNFADRDIAELFRAVLRRGWVA
jgi:hypothetical protein